MMRLSVTVEPWAYDPQNVEIRVRYETDYQTLANVQVIHLSEFESLFDACLRSVGGVIKGLWEQEKEANG